MTKPVSELSLAISEKEFATQVEDLLRIFGWKFEHDYEQKYYARRSSKGYPDYTAVRNGVLLFAELKSEKGKLTPEQVEWIEALELVAKHSVGVMVFVWRPSQYEAILEILR